MSSSAKASSPRRNEEAAHPGRCFSRPTGELLALVANRIAPDTRRDQACRDALRPLWWLVPPQRNFGAKPCPRVACIPYGYRRDDDASPLVAHGLGDSAISIHSDGARAASKSFE